MSQTTQATSETRLDGLPSWRLLLNMHEVGDALGLNRAQAYKLLQAGEIESVRIGRRRLVPLESLRAYVERLRAEAAAGRAA